MKINNQLEKLYQDWTTKSSTFVKGGVVDEDYYLSSDIKVLMLLKEVNSKDTGWSLVDLINSQIKDARYLDIWDTIGLWNWAIPNGFKPYKEMRILSDYYDKAGIAEGLSQIATTNLKKGCGGGQSTMDEIKNWATKDAELLKREIEIINPELVICGGTFEIVKEILGLNPEECSTGARFAKANEKLFLDMPHPRARISEKVLYAYYRDTMLQLGKDKLIRLPYSV